MNNINIDALQDAHVLKLRLMLLFYKHQNLNQQDLLQQQAQLIIIVNM